MKSEKKWRAGCLICANNQQLLNTRYFSRNPSFDVGIDAMCLRLVWIVNVLSRCIPICLDGSGLASSWSSCSFALTTCAKVTAFKVPLPSISSNDSKKDWAGKAFAGMWLPYLFLKAFMSEAQSGSNKEIGTP